MSHEGKKEKMTGPFVVLKKSHNINKIQRKLKLSSIEYNALKCSKPKYKCYVENCQYQFIQPVSLKKHMQNHFSKCDGFQCTYCPISFHKYSTLMVHLKSHSIDGKVVRKTVFETQKQSPHILTTSDQDSSSSKFIQDNNNINHKNESPSISLEENYYFDLHESLKELYSFVDNHNSDDFLHLYSFINEISQKVFHI